MSGGLLSLIIFTQSIGNVSVSEPGHMYSHNTSNRTNLHLYGVNSTFGKKCIKFKGAALWNDIPTSIKRIASFNKFKQILNLQIN